MVLQSVANLHSAAACRALAYEAAARLHGHCCSHAVDTILNLMHLLLLLHAERRCGQDGCCRKEPAREEVRQEVGSCRASSAASICHVTSIDAVLASFAVVCKLTSSVQTA